MPSNCRVSGPGVDVVALFSHVWCTIMAPPLPVFRSIEIDHQIFRLDLKASFSV